jgi:hypothetical protein
LIYFLRILTEFWVKKLRMIMITELNSGKLHVLPC